MLQQFDGKVVLVTGAASGIGRASAMAFARAGAKVLVADMANGEETARSIRAADGEALFVKTDVTRAEQVEALVRKAVDIYGRLDCAHNNAGIEGPVISTAQYSEVEWDRTIDVDLTGVWLCMKYEILQMLKQGGGSIVNTASAAGLIGFHGFSAYVAAKHGVVGLTKTAALEYARDGIRVNSICPGSVRTPMNERLIGGSPEVEKQMNTMQAVGRRAQPDEIANAALWLCSDAASFVTGVSMPVDGGMLSGIGAPH